MTPGSLAQNEVQQVTVSSIGFGFFVLKYRDAETDPIPFGASAADVQTALVALPLTGKNANGQPNVAVTGAAGGPYTVTFQNDLARQDVPQVTGREESTLVDGSLPAALAPGAGENLPEGLRGAFVTITDSPDFRWWPARPGWSCSSRPTAIPWSSISRGPCRPG